MALADTVIAYADRFRAALLAKDLSAQRRLISAYKGLYATITTQIDALVLQIANEEMTPGQVRKMRRYGQLLSDIEEQLTGYTAFTRSQISEAAKVAIQMGADSGRNLIAVSAGNIAFAARLQTLHPQAIETLLGFLSPDGPLYRRLSVLPAYTAEQVANAILEGVGMGQNPKVIARAITNRFGMGLTDSMRMMRTAQLYAYREANRASYLANDDIVSGWQWYAHLDGSVCLSCVRMHGTIHPLSERLNDHHNGRCVALPITFLSPDGIVAQGAGEKWFGEQPEAYQKQEMGKGRYEAWKGGQFTFDKLSSTRTDAVYGDMRVEATLKELIVA